jgi:FkbM family methyltransferase
MTPLTKEQVRQIVHGHFENPASVYRAFCQGVIPSPLELRGGMVIHHSPLDDIAAQFYEIFVRQCYTGKGFYRPKRGHVVFDVGANIGLFALYLSARAPGIRIHCFEPSRATSTRLLQNVKANALIKQVRVHRFALYNTCRRKQLLPARSSPCASLFANDNTVSIDRPTVVGCITLKKAFAMSRAKAIDFLKLDVEGAELEILDGATTHVLNKIRRIAIEYHSEIRPRSLGIIKRVLKQHGFSISLDTDWPYGHGLGILQAYRLQK